MKYLFLLCILTSCSSYKLVNTDDCEDVSGSIKLCREVE